MARVRRLVADAGRLAVCGAAYDGVGIPACIGSARRAVNELLTPADGAGGPEGTMRT
jgi:oxygen-dependent protoporphyrinogen oxidase